MAERADISLTADIKLSPDAESKLQRNLASLERRLRFGGPFAGMSRDLTSFNTQLDRATQRVITLGTAFSVLAGTTRIFREVVSSTLEVEKSLIDINAILKVTDQQLSSVGASLFNIARDTAQSFSIASKAATEFSRQGLSVTETLRRTADALILTRDAGIDVTDSVRAITAGINSFNREALTSTQIVNRLASADAAFAVSSKDLAEALTRTGSAASDAGVSFNQFIGLITAAQQISQRGGATIAQALNTIFTRIQRKDTLETLDSLGVAIYDVRGQMLPTLTVLQNFSRAYDTMSASIRNQSAELVGGVRNLNVLKATIDDLSKTNSVFAQTQTLVSNSVDEAARRNAARNQSLAAQVSQLGTTGQQIASNVGQIGFGKNAREVLGVLNNNPVTDALRNAGDATNESAGAEVARGFLKGFGGAISYGLVPLLITVLGKVSSRVFENLSRDIRSVADLSGQEEQRATIEKQIVTLYEAGGAALQQQLATMTSLTEKAALLNRYLSMGSAAPNVGPLANEVMRMRRTPRAAAGYVPMGEEAKAIASGVGGAPVGARPVYLAGFNRGGGQRGIVANTSEWKVEGAAGGAIFNRDMIYRHGLPPGATPVAAGGFIPNAADSFSRSDIRAAGGQFASQSTIDSLNQLFTTISKAETGTEARKLGKGVIDLAEGLSKASKSNVLDKLGAIYRDFDTGRLVKAGSYRAGGPGSVIESAPWSGQPYEIPPISFGRKSKPSAQDLRRAREGAMFDEVLAERRAAVRERNIADALSSLQPIGRRQPSRLRGIYNRFSSFANGPMGQIGLGFGLSALGGMVDPSAGVGGTSGGITRSALGYGLSAAGTGAIFGGLPGALAGGVIGGFYGALTKATKSVDEMAAEIDKRNKKLAEDLTNTQEVFRLQEDLKNVLANPALTSAQRDSSAAELRQQRNAQIAQIKNPRYLSLATTGLNDPNSPAEAARLANQETLTNRQRDNLLLAVSQGKLTSGALFGGGEIGGPAVKALQEQLTPILKDYSDKDLGSMGRTLNEDGEGGDTSRHILADLMRKAGISQAEINQAAQGGLSGPFAKNSLLAAIHGVSSSRISGQNALDPVAQKAREEAAALRPGRIVEASAYRRGISGHNQAFDAGQLQLEQLRQTLGLESSPLSDLDRLRVQGVNNVANIRAQGQIDQRAALGEGVSGLLGSLPNLSVEEGAFSRVRGLGSLKDLESLQSDLNLPAEHRPSDVSGLSNASFTRPLADLIEQMKKLGYSTEQQINVEQESNRLRVQQILKSRTLDAAIDEETKQMNDLNDAIAGAKARNDPREVIEQLELNRRSITRRAGVRSGALAGISYSADQKEADDLSDSLGLQSTQASRRNRALITLGRRNDSNVSGSDLSSALFGEARKAGQSGDTKGSLFGGFQSVFAGIKRDILDLSDIGQRTAQSLEQNLGNAFGDFVTGAKKGKDAFRDFAISVLNDASRMLASKAISAALSFIPGFGGAAKGGRMGFAGGGMVPSMVMGGEIYIGPQAARQIGHDKLAQINNGYASGGEVLPIKGGSGTHDDLPANMPSGSFIVRKSVADKLGPDYFRALAGGQVQHRFLGGLLLPMLLGGALGGGAGYLAGGKKGAIAGALLGAAGGGLYGQSVGNAINLATGGEAATLTIGQKAAIGFAGAAGLGALSSAIGGRSSDGPGPISNAQIPAYRAALESAQASEVASQRSQGNYPYLQMNSSGGQSLASYGGAVGVKIEINNHGGISSSSQQEGGGLGPDFGEKLGRTVRGMVQEELVRQSRSDGFFSQRGRYVQAR